jgi:transposase
MKAISSADKVNGISLLLSGHSIRKVESITGLGKSTVGRIYQQVEMDKDNHKKNRLSKLSPAEQRRIVSQTTTGKLDNAVQATNYINTIIQNLVCPQTVRKTLKRSHLKAVVKAKKPLFKVTYRQRRLDFALYHQNWTVED